LRDVSDRRAAEDKLRRSEERFRSLTGSLPVGAFEFDLHGRLTYVNEKWHEINGYAPEDQSDVDAWAALVSSPNEGVLEAWSAAVRESRSFEAQIQVRTAQGDDRWLSASTSPVESADGVVRSFVGTIHDITDLVTARSEIERFKEIIDQTSDYVGVVDGEGRTMYFNRAGREAVGIAIDDPVASFEPRSIYPAWAWRRLVDEAIPVVMRGEVWSGELALLTPDGRGERPITQVLFAHRDADGEIAYLASISRDVTDEKALAARLHHQATHDQLTGLPQRVVFTDRLRDALTALAAPTPDGDALVETGLGVLFFDIDGFKAVNDSLGHHAGDELLRVLARRLEGALRDGDTPARFAGDEFVVLCHDLADDGQALEVAERVRRHVTGAVRLPPATANEPDRTSEIEIRISMGVVRARRGETVEDVVRRADLAMYAAKAGGGDRIHLSS
jgi:diguanylate cyclase (GGDEF)-like protein/PAS domain S-box-containing protein